MKTYMKRALGLLVAMGAMSLTSMQVRAADADPLESYYGNTVACQNQVTKATCRLWLNRDGKYFSFYDVGTQAKMPDSNGPFKINGREGTFTLRKENGNYKLCLWVAAPRIKITAEQQREIYSEGACYPFTPKKVGDSWTEKDLMGRDVKMWLMQGR
ncbi:MAG: hypothetical protein QM808_12905 [Steroidobacteraceae bacterium]